MGKVIKVVKKGVVVEDVKDAPPKQLKDKAFFFKQAKKKVPKSETRVHGLRKK